MHLINNHHISKGTSRLLAANQASSETASTLSGNSSLLLGAKFFLSIVYPFLKGGVWGGGGGAK